MGCYYRSIFHHSSLLVIESSLASMVRRSADILWTAFSLRRPGGGAVHVHNTDARIEGHIRLENNTAAHGGERFRYGKPSQLH